MSEPLENTKPDDTGDQTPESQEEEVAAFPLRERSEDPRWAVGIVWTWVVIAVFLLLFIIVLFVLGWWFD